MEGRKGGGGQFGRQNVPRPLRIWTNRSIRRPCHTECPSRFFNLPPALYSLAYYKYIWPSEPGGGAGGNRPLHQILDGICTSGPYLGRSENPGVSVLFSGHNLPLLVENGLTDLLKSVGPMAPPAPPGTTPLL